MCMHLRQETQPVGPAGCSCARPQWALQRPGRGHSEPRKTACPLRHRSPSPACASAGLPPQRSSHRSSAGVSHPALPPPWALAGRGPRLPASHSPHLAKFLVQPSKSGTQNGPRRLCSHLHLKGSTVPTGDASRYCPPGLRKDESCHLLPPPQHALPCGPLSEAGLRPPAPPHGGAAPQG